MFLFFSEPERVRLVYLKKYNIGVKFVQSLVPADFAAAIDENTKAIYVETIGNPNYIVPDIAGLAQVSCSGLISRPSLPNRASSQVAHDNGIPLIIDNTFGMGGEHKLPN